MRVKPPIPADQPELNWVESPWVQESRLGRWLMGSRLWYQRVLKPNCALLARLNQQPWPRQAALLDAGCGEGLAFKLLEQYFQPRIIFGLDIDKEAIPNAIARAGRLKTPTHVMQGDVSLASFKDETFDIIFAHHLLQYREDQTAVLQKMHALLKPGGVLVAAEFCRVFTGSWWVRLLFRHPPSAQQSADDYVRLVRAEGFAVDAAEIQTARPWWTQGLFGLAQLAGLSKRAEPGVLLLIARKPLMVEAVAEEVSEDGAPS